MFQKNQTKSQLQATIDQLHAALAVYPPETNEYDRISDQLVKLSAIEDPKSSKRVSPDVLATVAANLIGIGMILHYERANVIASKALGFVQKLR
jgi:hypothetical protein